MFTAAMCVWAGDNDKLFRNALESILSQTLLPCEIVLIGDGPLTDMLYQHIREIKHKIDQCSLQCDFQYIELDANYGHGVARRASIDNAKGDFVAICDADDFNHKNRFELQYHYLENNVDTSLVGSQIREQNLLLDSAQSTVRSVPITNDEIITYAAARCPFNQMTVMFRRVDILSVGGYEDFYCNEDYFLWFRLIKAKKKLANLKDILVTAHIDTNSFKRRGGVKYFLSEVRIKRLFLDNGMLGYFDFLYNVSIRFVLQILLPGFVRQLIFKLYLREK